MDFSGITRIGKHLVGVTTKHAPTIFTVLTGAGVIVTVILAIDATPKAIHILEEERHRVWLEIEKNRAPDDHHKYSEKEFVISRMDVVKLVWRCYIPAAIAGVATIGLGIGANSINLRRNAALASVYGITKATLKEYEDKVVETIGANKARKIKDEIAQDHLTRNPIESNQVFLTGRGEMLCYDKYSGRYFKGDIDKIRKTENKLNRQMLADIYVSLNDVYGEIGLPYIPLGDDVGWNRDYTLTFVDPFPTMLSTDEQPCLVIDFMVGPKPGYKDLY
jgi:hypothetical protein